MNNISDYEAHRRDEEYDRIHGKTDWDRLQKCPVHEIPLIIARGFTVNGVTKTTVFSKPQCPECEKKAKDRSEFRSEP